MNSHLNLVARARKVVGPRSRKCENVSRGSVREFQRSSRASNVLLNPRSSVFFKSGQGKVFSLVQNETLTL